MARQLVTVKGVTAAANAVVFPANPRRTGLVINPPSAGVLLVSLGADSAALPLFVMVAGSTPFVVDSSVVGDALFATVNVSSPQAGNLFSVSQIIQ